jgi:hypothetical protein
MENFTLHVEVMPQAAVENGFEVKVRPTAPGAEASLDSVFSAHPAVLKQETGWNMRVVKDQGLYTIRVTTTHPDETPKIRGLGYIGILALGKHHQLHHWQIATGSDPHHGH